VKFDQTLAESVAAAEDERALERGMHAIADHVGASFFQALRFASTDHGKALDEMGSYSDGLIETFNDLEWQDWRDPVMQHVRCSSTPILWDRQTYEVLGHPGVRAYEAMADFGVGFGASVALHLGAFRHFTMALAWPHKLVPDAKQLMELQLYTLYAEPAFYRVWSRSELAALAPEQALTQRELETLYMASRGLKVPGIAALIQRSPRTVEKFAQGAMAKLGAATMIEAVSIGERLQLFDAVRASDAVRKSPRRWRL